MIDDICFAPASPLAFMLCAVRMLQSRLALHPLYGRPARKLQRSAVQLDRALCAALDVYPDETALMLCVPEIERRVSGLGRRAFAVGLSLTPWLQAMMPEPTAVEMRLSIAALTLIGMARLRALIEGVPLSPRRAHQLKAVVAAETPLRRIVEAEAAGELVSPAWVEAADAAAWAVEDAIGADLLVLLGNEPAVTRVKAAERHADCQS